MADSQEKEELLFGMTQQQLEQLGQFALMDEDDRDSLIDTALKLLEKEQ